MIKQESADFFICHANEDKEEFVRDLAETLMKNGANVFYDEYSIKLGDSLTDSINKGIKTSDNAIIVLSNYFFEKSWTQAELQAIFHKSRSTDYKIFIIYHNISNAQVTEKYPLLSDIKAINSSDGLNKIIEELFKAINKKASLSYIFTDLKGGTSTSIGTGFSLGLRFGFPFLGDKRVNKTLFEIGTPKQYNNRIRINLEMNERLYFEVIDKNYKKLCLPISIKEWKLNEQHIYSANIDTDDKVVFLMLDGKIIEEMKFPDLEIPDDFMVSERAIFGCSLELENPCPFIVSFQTIGKSLTKEQAKGLHDSIKQFCDSISKIK